MLDFIIHSFRFSQLFPRGHSIVKYLVFLKLLTWYSNIYMHDITMHRENVECYSNLSNVSKFTVTFYLVSI